MVVQNGFALACAVGMAISQGRQIVLGEVGKLITGHVQLTATLMTRNFILRAKGSQ